MSTGNGQAFKRGAITLASFLTSTIRAVFPQPAEKRICPKFRDHRQKLAEAIIHDRQKKICSGFPADRSQWARTITIPKRHQLT
jgi:hypothetical protein